MVRQLLLDALYARHAVADVSRAQPVREGGCILEGLFLVEVLACEGSEGGEVREVARVRLAAALLALPLEVMGAF